MRRHREASTRRPSLRALSLFGALVFTGFAAVSCLNSDKESLSVAKLSEGCTINSDCRSPLVCAFKRCHDQCETSRDCPIGQRCMASDRPFHVCQLPEETTCVYNSECPEGQICGLDGECRDLCVSTRDCVQDQVCVSGTCADTEELNDDGQLTAVDAGVDFAAGGQPCSYNSECKDPLVCREGVCALECLGTSDCQEGYSCVSNRCRPPSCGVGSPEAGAPCFYQSECPDPLVCRDGACMCECLADEDCEAGLYCVDNRCADQRPVSDAGTDSGKVFECTGDIGCAVIEGKFVFVVDMTVPDGTGDAVCAAQGLSCLGAPVFSTPSAACEAFHPGAAVSSSVNGWQQSVYCDNNNGAACTGVTGCHDCPACVDTGLGCKTANSDQLKELYVECGTPATQGSL